MSMEHTSSITKEFSNLGEYIIPMYYTIAVSNLIAFSVEPLK